MLSMNPYAIIASLVLTILGVCGAGWIGFQTGIDHQKSSESDRNEAIRLAADQASQVAAAAINKIKVVNTTIQQEIQHETRTNTVYLDCRHTPDGLRLINSTLSGDQTITPGGSQLPQIDPAER